MSQKKKKRTRSRRRKVTAPRTLPARFAVGDAVRVKKGVPDPDYPDLSLGGWAGTVSEIAWAGGAPLYLVFWNQHTLEQLPPAYHQRCDEDGFEADNTWLGEEDLEPDWGEPVEIESLNFEAGSHGDHVLDYVAAEGELEFPTSGVAAVLTRSLACLVGALYGGILGALIGSVTGAGIGAGVGGGLLMFVNFMGRDRPGVPVFELLSGLAIGALAGALLVAMGTVYMGTGIGAGAGALLALGLFRPSRRRRGAAACAAIGACLGALVGVICREPAQAGHGAMWGAVAGAAAVGGRMLFGLVRTWWVGRRSAR